MRCFCKFVGSENFSVFGLVRAIDLVVKASRINHYATKL